jgi:hypothetical protein
MNGGAGRRSPNGLELLLLALLLGECGGEGGGGAVLDGRGGRRPLLLQGVQLVDVLRAHRRRDVVVPHPVLVLLLPVSLDPRQWVRGRHLARADFDLQKGKEKQHSAS